MRKIIILLLALALAACGAPAATPTQQAVVAPVQPTATPVVVVETVIVTVIPTLAPTDVPLPTQPPPPASTLPPTQAPAATAGTTGGPIALDNNLGAGVFINMTMSSDLFTLRCFPRDITFNITSNNSDIRDALLYYRIVDNPKALYPSEWKNAGKMVAAGNGNFSIVFSGEDVHPDLRLDLAWFDFQFIGLNKGGAVIDRTQKIERLVTYRIDCP